MNNQKPLLGPCDSYQLEPFQYEWAWLMAYAQENNNWSPNEIPVGNDVADYKDPTLDPKHRHLFESVMAQLTTFDIERGDDAAETFLSIFQPAEIRHYFKRLVWEEGLHTRSYRYVIENLGIPLSIYDRWREVPAMRARVEMAQAMSRPVEKIIGAHLLNKTPYHELNVKDKQAILRSMIFWHLVFEGVQFWISLLGPIQQLARLNRFKGGAEQFQYIARDECVIQGTEVLTPYGWLPVERVTMDTELIQWHVDNTLSWTKPVKLSAHFADHYYEFSLPTRGYKQVVSAKHRYPYYTKDGNLKVIAAEKATPNPYSKHPMTGKLRAGLHEDKLTLMARFLVALQADGSEPSDRYTGEYCGTVPYNFTFAKQRKIVEFDRILADLKLNHTKVLKKDGKYTYRVSGPVGLTKNFSDWVELGTRSVTWCRDFIEEIGKWDGHVVKENPSRITYSSISKENVDIVQAVASLAGYRTKYTLVVDDRSKTFSDIHRLFISRHQDTICGGRIEKSRVNKSEFMYGIEVPSSFILIRKDQCVSVTGNSSHIGFGIALVKEFMAQHPECITEQFLVDVAADTRKAMVLEGEYIAYCLKDGPILGYSAPEHLATAKFFANMRMAQANLPQLFDDAYHAFPWMSEQMELNKEKSFFEVRTVEYQSGGALTFDDDPDSKGHDGWADPLGGM